MRSSAFENILCIGAFLSKSTGTKGPTERLAEQFQRHEVLRFLLVSRRRNPLLRAFEIALALFFRRFSVAHVDVYSGRAFWYTRLAMALAQWRGKPCLLTLHGGRLAEFYTENPRVVDAIFARATRICTPSRRLQHFFQEKGWAVEYLPNGIDLTHFREARNPKRSGHALLWVRAFADIYHPELAVETLHRLLPHFPQATLTMIGPDKGRLANTRRLAERLAISEKIRILGPVPNEVLPEIFHAHDVLLNTTVYESFGLAVAEAAACGVPVVSTAVGEIPYLWQPETDILLAERPDAESFAKQLQRLFENPTLAGALRQNATRRVQEFDAEKIKSHWANLLRSVATNNRTIP